MNSIEEKLIIEKTKRERIKYKREKIKLELEQKKIIKKNDVISLLVVLSKIFKDTIDNNNITDKTSINDFYKAIEQFYEKFRID